SVPGLALTSPLRDSRSSRTRVQRASPIGPVLLLRITRAALNETVPKAASEATWQLLGQPTVGASTTHSAVSRREPGECCQVSSTWPVVRFSRTRGEERPTNATEA